MHKNGITINYNTVTCCYNCKKRTVGCHGTCDEYLAQKAKNNKIKEKIVKQRHYESDTLCQISRSNLVTKKRKR